MQVISLKTARQQFNICSSNYIDESVKFIIPDEDYGIRIGKNNFIFQGCVIFAASGYRENTIIGDNNFIMPSCTISSDVYIGNNNKILSSSYIGSFSSILNNCRIESNCVITNYTTVGSYAQIGALTPVVKDVLPFSKVFGNPASMRGYVSGKAISSFDTEQVEQIKNYVISNTDPTNVRLISIVDEYNNHSRKKQTK